MNTLRRARSDRGSSTTELVIAMPVLLMLIIGGTGYLYGGIVGSALFLVAQKFFGNITPQYWEFWIGFALVVIALFARDRGLFSIVERIAAWRKRGAKP